jgi:hypothetical protein
VKHLALAYLQIATLPQCQSLNIRARLSQTLRTSKSRWCHETFAPCHPDHDGYRGRRRRIDGFCAAGALPRWKRSLSNARPGWKADGKLPRDLWRFWRRPASIPRARARPWWAWAWRRLAPDPEAPRNSGFRLGLISGAFVRRENRFPLFPIML